MSKATPSIAILNEDTANGFITVTGTLIDVCNYMASEGLTIEPDGVFYVNALGQITVNLSTGGSGGSKVSKVSGIITIRNTLNETIYIDRDYTVINDYLLPNPNTDLTEYLRAIHSTEVITAEHTGITELELANNSLITFNPQDPELYCATVDAVNAVELDTGFFLITGDIFSINLVVQAAPN